MAKVIVPTDATLGYKDCGTHLQGVTFGKHDADIQKSFSFLVRWELGRRIQPNGPLPQKIITQDALRRWKNFSSDQAVCHDLHKLASHYIKKKAEGPLVPLPKALDAAFWQKLSDVGGEAAAIAAGNLSFQVVIERHTSDRLYFKMKMAPPVLEISRRILRQHSTERFIRAKVDQDLLWQLQDPILYREGGETDGHAQHRLQAAGNLMRQFQHIFYKPIHILDGAYRLFYGKAGTRSLFLWSERSLSGQYSDLFVPDLLNKLIPMSEGKNPDLSIAKYAARISLFDSQTIPVRIPDFVAWVPDLTSHTLAISPREMNRLAKRLDMPFVPSCLSGSINGESFVWSCYHGTDHLRSSPTSKKLAVFADTLQAFRGSSRQPKQLVVEFSIHLGAERTIHTHKATYDHSEIIKRDRPAYEQVVMTDGNGLLSWSFARRIHETLGLKGQAIATAYQARIGGCKGLWNLPCDFDPDGQDGEWIEIRASQHKCDVPLDAFSFDVVRRSTPSHSGSIGPQALTILRQVCSMGEKTVNIDDVIESLRKEAGEQADYTFLEEEDIPTLMNALEKNLHTSHTSSLGTLRGPMKYGYRDPDDEEIQLYEEAGVSDMHPLSGQPVQWEAQVQLLLFAGFPLNHPYVRGRLQQIKEGVVKLDKIAKCPIPKSRHAFVIVDHTGTLLPDQVFFQSSTPMIDPYTDRQMGSVLTGKVLLNRSPTAQATDWQLCHAVNLPQLSNLFDVVVCSAKGPIPFMAKLSGGDYDGDMVDVIWEPRLTVEWENASDKYIVPPFQTEEYFAKQPVQIGNKAVFQMGEFHKVMSKDGLENTRYMQDAVLMPFFLPTSYGTLSKLHDVYLRARGVCDSISVTAGHLYTAALDATKQGLRFKYAHLNDETLQILIRVKVLGDTEDARARAAESDSDSGSSSQPGYLTPSKKKHDNGDRDTLQSKRAPSSIRKADRSPGGVLRRNSADQVKTSPKPGLDNHAKPYQDADLVELWRTASGNTDVFPREAGTPLEQMKHFANSELQRYRAHSDKLYSSRSPKDDGAKTYQREANFFLSKFWEKANLTIGRLPYSVTSQLTWRHLLISCVYEVASSTALSSHWLALLCDRFVLLVGFKFLCDMKATTTSHRSQSAPGFPDILGPTMVNYAILASKAQKRAKSLHTAAEQENVQGETTVAISPKRKSAPTAVSSSSPSKRAKDNYQLWTPTKKQGRRMGVEVSPLSNAGTPSRTSSLLTSEEEDVFSGMLDDDLHTEEEELMNEIDELLKYRDVDLADDSGIGSSQGTVQSDKAPDSPCKGRETTKSSRWILSKLPKNPFSQYLGAE